MTEHAAEPEAEPNPYLRDATCVDSRPECWMCVREHYLHLKRETAAELLLHAAGPVSVLFQSLLRSKAEEALGMLDTQIDAALLYRAQGARAAVDGILVFLRDFAVRYDARLKEEQEPTPAPKDETEEEGD